MEYKLQDSGQEFVRVLENRKVTLQAQNERKKLFGGESDLGKPMNFTPPPAQAPPKHTQNNTTSSSSSTYNPFNTDDYALAQTQQQLIPDHRFVVFFFFLHILALIY